MDLHQSKNLFKEKPKTFDFVLLSLLTAMNMVLGEVLCITVSTEIKIGFSFIPIFIGARLEQSMDHEYVGSSR